jgi:cation diffusion facilitator CzcD-associated flavoprotein CzcO
MAVSRETQTSAGAAPVLDYDAIIIGAGMSGLYQLYRLRQLGMRVRVLEAGTGVGGTWYWNRYPGARFDSESYSYSYSFSKELLEEWNWSEHFAAQPETLRYLKHVADKFDLRRDIQFRSRVAAAHYQEDTRSWDVTLEDGSRQSARFLITAIGPLSAPTMPRIRRRRDVPRRSLPYRTMAA